MPAIELIFPPLGIEIWAPALPTQSVNARSAPARTLSWRVQSHMNTMLSSRRRAPQAAAPHLILPLAEPPDLVPPKIGLGSPPPVGVPCASPEVEWGLHPSRSSCVCVESSEPGSVQIDGRGNKLFMTNPSRSSTSLICNGVSRSENERTTSHDRASALARTELDSQLCELVGIGYEWLVRVSNAGFCVGGLPERTHMAGNGFQSA